MDDIKSLTLDYFHEWINRGRELSDPLRSKILEINLGLVGLCAGKVIKKTTESWDDIYNEGVIGLSIAIDKYQPSKGKFSPYAVKFIQGQMIRYLRDRAGPLVRTPRREYDTVSKINKRAREQGVRPLSVAIELGYSLDEWDRMVLSTQRSSVGTIENIDVIADQFDDDADDDDNLHEGIKFSIDKYCLELGSDGVILKLHFHPDYGLPIKAIATRMRLKPSQVTKSIKRSIDYIREAIR